MYLRLTNYYSAYGPKRMSRREIFSGFVLPGLVLALVVIGGVLFINNLANIVWVLSTPLVKVMP